MRVVILYNTSWYVFLLRRNLIRALQRAGCDIAVIAPEDAYTERVKALGVSFVPLALSPRSVNPASEALTIFSTYRALRSARPDWVLSYTAKCNLYAGLARPLVGFRQVANVSGLGEGFQRAGALQAVMRRLYRRALFRCDQVFFQNSDDYELCISAGLADRSRSTIIPGSGVDLSAFVPAPKPFPGPITFLMFGRLLPQKGFASFIRAAGALKQRYGERVAFWILGAADYERPESLKLLEEIMAAHAAGSIRYLQSTDDVRSILRDTDVAVLPSTYNEGVPRSLLEALACGKVVVTTDWKGCRETVVDGRNGLLVPTYDDAALQDALERIILMPDAERLRMGAEGRALAERRFDERIVIEAYKGILGLSRVMQLPSRKSAALARGASAAEKAAPPRSLGHPRQEGHERPSWQ